jgi:hypothetical protein
LINTFHIQHQTFRILALLDDYPVNNRVEHLDSGVRMRLNDKTRGTFPGNEFLNMCKLNP